MAFPHPHAIALLALAATACGGDDAPAPPGTPPPATAAAPAIRGDTVDVVLDEYAFSVPDTVPSGRVVFALRNAGFEEHTFELKRGERVWQTERPLNPGGRAALEVELEPGTYRIECSVSSHDARGMVADLVVAPPP